MNISKNKKIDFRSVWTNPIHFVACGFGVGLLPYAPGTWGTLASIPIYFILIKFNWLIYLLIVLLMNIFGVWICGKTNRDFNTDDHPAAVWDEIASFPIVMFGIPYHLSYLIIGFILFRIFDIWKPWPIRWVDQNIHGGIGVMLDDICAAVVSLTILQLFIFLRIL